MSHWALETDYEPIEAGLVYRICKDRYIDSQETFGYQNYPIIKYSWQFELPLGMYNKEFISLLTEEDLIKYIEDSKIKISQLLEAAATQELLQQIENL